MKKFLHKFILIYFLAFISNVSSQSQFLNVEYEIDISDNVEFEKKNDKFLKDNKQFSSSNYSLATRKIYYLLECNEKESLFTKIEELESDFEHKMNLVDLLLTNQKVYTNSKIILGKPKIEALGNILIQHNKIEWELKSEKKLIDDLVCHKANGSYKIPNTDKIINVVAWYNPKIALPWGPDFFSGLPGLILEVNTSQNLSYKMTKIEFATKNLIIRPEGEIITEKKMNSILSDLRESFRN